MHFYPKLLIRLIETFKKLPGIGTRSAERFVFELLRWRPDQIKELGAMLIALPDIAVFCSVCGALKGADACPFCTTERLASRLICVVADFKDIYHIEQTREYEGAYHCIGGLLSPLEGRGPDRLSIERLKNRIQQHEIQEIVLALDSTLEGDATALYLKKELQADARQVSRLAFGLPVGSSLEYIDGGTLAQAFAKRTLF